MTDREIIAYGGGGLSSENPLLDLYIIAQAKKFYPKVCFLPTASGDNESYIKYFNQVYGRYPCNPTHLSLFNPHTKDIKDFIMSQDIIIVGGGNSLAMMALWRGCFDIDRHLKSAYDNGTILAGGSAGSVVWFNECITDSVPGELSVMKCLNFLPYSHCPHFKSQSRQDSYRSFLNKGEITDGFAIDDCAIIHFKNEVPFRSVHSEYDHDAYYMSSSVNNKMCSLFLKNRKIRNDLIFNSIPFGRQHKKVRMLRSYCDEQFG